MKKLLIASVCLWNFCIINAMDHMAIQNEIYDSSRALTSQEQQDMQMFASKIIKKHGIDEIRIIDAESLINSMYLPKNEKNHFLYLLRDGKQEEIDAEVIRFLDVCEFHDEPASQLASRMSFYAASNKFAKPYLLPINSSISIKDFITDSLLTGIHYSPIYRDVIIALIAKFRSIKPMSYDLYSHEYTELPSGSLFVTNNKKIKFFSNSSISGETIFSKNEIHMNINDKTIFYVISPMSSGKGQGVYIPNISTLFHEMGHLLSGSIGIVTNCNPFLDFSKSATMAIASEAFITERNIENMKYNFDVIDNYSYEQLSFIKSAYKELFGLTFSDDNTIKKFLKEAENSDVLCTWLAEFQDNSELMQIHGFFTHLYKGKTVFYLNKLSDAAAFISLQFPMRVDHIGTSLIIDENDVDSSSDSELKKSVTLNVNLDFYRMLAMAYGVNVYEYFRNIKNIQTLPISWIIPAKSLIYALGFMKEMNNKYHLVKICSPSQAGRIFGGKSRMRES
ncbi:MAG: hypothetical protein IJ730_05855 [Alphaproteobacteria bacterium]|nr:hypothetical protein [Alphaproteobacteria bacterium]